MATKKKAASKKKAAPGEALREPTEIPVNIQVKTPDGKTHKATYTIVNAHTCLLASQINNGQALLDATKQGLVSRFGVNYVK
jgi:hypothetical protein